MQAVVYRSVAAKSLSEETVEQLAEGEIEGVILLSPRTAAVYASLMRRQGLSTVARTLTHFCVPVNDVLLGYWDKVEDRLQKVR